MIFSIFTFIPILSTLISIFNQRSKRILRIFLDVFQYIHLGHVFCFIGIEDYINTIGEVFWITIDSHTFDILLTINHDTNLRVSGFTKRQVLFSRTKLYNTVFVNSTIFFITNHQSLRIKTFRICKFSSKPFTTIDCSIIIYSMYVFKIIDCTMRCSRRT